MELSKWVCPLSLSESKSWHEKQIILSLRLDTHGSRTSPTDILAVPCASMPSVVQLSIVQYTSIKIAATKCPIYGAYDLSPSTVKSRYYYLTVSPGVCFSRRPALLPKRITHSFAVSVHMCPKYFLSLSGRFVAHELPFHYIHSVVYFAGSVLELFCHYRFTLFQLCPKSVRPFILKEWNLSKDQLH